MGEPGLGKGSDLPGITQGVVTGAVRLENHMTPVLALSLLLQNQCLQH